MDISALLGVERGVTALIGGGGKTTLMCTLAEELRRRGFNRSIKIAVMGCVVNGPGEAREADIGIAGGKDEALLFIRGEKIRMLRGDIVGQLVEEIYKL